VALFLCYSLYREQRVLLKDVNDHQLLKRQVTHILLPIFTTALVFSSNMHDRLFFKEVYGLDPSSL
jgi:hypothetical protein